MPYTRPYSGGFIDYPNTTTPLTASALNTMDLGIKSANDQIQTLTTAQRTALTPTLGQIVFDSTLNELFVYLNVNGGNAWVGLGNSVICTSTTRPLTPFIGQIAYQTDTDELIKYVTDFDGVARWMQADHDYRRNFVINGGFDIWQRGTTFNPASSTSTTGANYGADRWQFLQATTNASGFTRQAITSSDPAGYNYYLRVQRANTATLTTAFTVQTSFESQNIQRVRGQYVTLSFWARAGANYSAASSFLVSNIVTGTGTDNTVGNFTTNTVNTTTNNVLTTSWKRFVITTSAALATTITQLGVSFVFTPVGTAGAADYFDITGVQLETGTAPSDFEPRDIGEELRRCQRYYYRTPTGAFGPLMIFSTQSAIAGRGWLTFPVTMRQAPTGLALAGSAPNVGTGTYTSVSFDRASAAGVMANLVGTGWTVGGGNFLYGNTDGTTYIEFTGAEL